MKKNVVCHYKNGSLLFCTTKGYAREQACHIMEVFASHKLTSAMQPLGNSLFRIVGRLNVHYDPFGGSDVKWDDVLSTMNATISGLEENMKGFFQNNTRSIEAKYVIRK